jgi:hypothetical protein
MFKASTDSPLLKARSLGIALVAINISPLLSESDSICTLLVSVTKLKAFGRRKGTPRPSAFYLLYS